MAVIQCEYKCQNYTAGQSKLCAQHYKTTRLYRLNKKKIEERRKVMTHNDD